jgi:hypothetical protein
MRQLRNFRAGGFLDPMETGACSIGAGWDSVAGHDSHFLITRLELARYTMYNAKGAGITMVITIPGNQSFWCNCAGLPSTIAANKQL